MIPRGARDRVASVRTTIGALAAAATLVALPACGDEPAPSGPQERRATRSLLLDDSGHLWIASPDDRTLVAIDPESLVVRETVPLPGPPHHLDRVGRTLVATSLAATDVWRVDLDTRVVSSVRVPCGGTWGVVAIPDQPGLAAVTCANDARVVIFDTTAEPEAAVIGTLALDGRPTAIAAGAGRIHVADSSGGRVLAVPTTRISRRAADPWVPVPTTWDVATVGVDPGRTASTVDAFAWMGDTLVPAFQSVDHDGDRDRPPVPGAYGALVDGNPRFDPRLGAPCASPWARFDGRERVFAGPSAVAATDDLVWVVHTLTRNVAVLRCRPGDDGRLPLVASFRVGHGARGIVLSPDGRTAWVDVAFDHAVARLDLVEGPYEAPPTATRRRDVVSTLSTRAQAGRRRFHDALDTQLTPSGVVACASCHPGGGDDGLSWFLHTEQIPRKLRRTPVAWGLDPTLPLHWDGAFSRADALVTATVRDLMGGLALGIDPGELVAWMEENPAPPPRPLRDDERSLVERGRALFFDATIGCAGCHVDATGSDGATHAVLPRSDDPDADLPLARTPALRAVRARPPWLHDGRAASLDDIITLHNPDDTHGTTSHLGADDRAALVAYLNAL